MSTTTSSKDQMTNTSRVWIYQAGKSLTAEESKELQSVGQSFVEQWASHGNKLASSFEVRHNRFAIISVDEAQAGASGCSIDTSVHFMQEMEQRFDTSFFDRMILCFLDGDQIITNGTGSPKQPLRTCSPKDIKSCTMPDIPQLVKSGVLTKETIIFDNTIQSKVELDSRWKVKMGDSWAGRYF